MNHTKYIFTILFLAIAQFASAQKKTIPYEKLESFSNTISDLQIKANGRIIKHSNGNKEELAFKKDNFKIWSYNNLVTWSFTTKVNGQSELLGITEEIDLSKAIGLILDNEALYIFFPQDLNIQVYVDDEVRTISRPVMDLYFNSNSADDKNKMFAYVYELISLLKIEKGLITKSEADNHLKEYRSLNPYEFYQKYPKSVLAYEGKLLEEDYERQVKFINSFAQRYNVPNLGKINVKELKLKIPETKKVFKRRRLYHEQAILKPKDLIDKNPVFVSYVVAYNWKEYRAGSIRDDFDEANIVSGIGYTIAITQNKEEAMEKYNSILKELSSNINNNLATVSKNQNTFILKFNKKIPYESIHLNFLEHNVGKSKWYEVNLLFNPNNYWSKLWE